MNGWMRWIRRCAVGVAVLLVAATIGAYPIPPKTLWNLVQESGLVVLAYVDERGECVHNSDPRMWTPARARLSIVDTLKGESDGSIEVAYEPDLACPAPARFVEGRTVLAFLDWDDELGAWTVPQLSYGTLYPAERDLPLFRRLIAKALALQAVAKEPQRPPVQWLVEAAEHRATRWHGLYELASQFDTIHSYYDRGSTREDLRPQLDAAHRARIARGFAAEPSADPSFVQTLGIVGDQPDEEFDRTAIGLIEAAMLDDEAAYWLSDAVELTLLRLGDRTVGERILAIGENPWNRPIADLRQLWTKAKVDLALPDVEPLRVESEDEEEEVRGVGGRTPS